MPAREPTTGGSSQAEGEADEIESSGDLHQALLREVNERIEKLNGEWEQTAADTVLCECGHPGCLEKIDIAPVDYERVRRFPARFIVKPGHVMGGSERIVERRLGYVVVEKVGASAATAIRRDPRRRSPNEQALLL